MSSSCATPPALAPAVAELVRLTTESRPSIKLTCGQAPCPEEPGTHPG